MFLRRREKEGRLSGEEEKDSCPTTTQSSQRNCVISRRHYISSISASLAPSVHPSTFQTIVYIECTTAYVMSSSLAFVQYPFSPCAQNCRLIYWSLFLPGKNYAYAIFVCIRIRTCYSKRPETQNSVTLISVYLQGCYGDCNINDASNGHFLQKKTDVTMKRPCCGGTRVATHF